MNHEKLLQDFIKKQTENWVIEDFNAMSLVLFESKANIIANLSEAIRQACCQANIQQASGIKGIAEVICISFLRTNIMDNIWEYRVDIYDDKFFRDPVECFANYKMDFVWNFLKTRMEKLDMSIKASIYVNKVRPYHLEEIKMLMAEQYHVAAETITKLAIAEAVKIPEYDTLQKADNFKIIMGDYWDTNVLLYEAN
jgi:hypothetical protein